MATDVTEVALDPALSTQVDFVSAVRGESSLLVDEIQVSDTYITVRWSDSPNTFTARVPWSNIKSVSQVA